MTILSYKTIFGLTLSAISENLLELFFGKVPKTVILAIFWHLAKIGQNEFLYKKSGRAILYPYCPPTLCQVSEKSFWSGFRDQFITNGHTDIRTDKGDLIEPVDWFNKHGLSMKLS